MYRMVVFMKLFLILIFSVFLGAAATGQKSVKSKKSLTTKAAVKNSGTAQKSNSPVALEEVKFKGENINLAGVLSFPKSSSPLPTVLIVPDYFSTRDGIPTLKGVHNSFRDLATHLNANGFAVLRYDRRCTGASECMANSAMANGVEDAYQAVQYLKTRKEIDPKNIFVLGHGDGAILAAGIAAHPDLVGCIVVAAPGRNPSKLLRDWSRQAMLDKKFPEAEIKKQMDRVENVIIRMTEGGHQAADSVNDYSNEYLVELQKLPGYAFSWLLDDPLQVYPGINGAALIVQGAKDRRVKTKDAVYVEDSLKVGEHKDFEAHQLPNFDYFMKENKGEATPASDYEFSRPLDPAFLKLLDGWLAKKLKK